MRRTSGSRSVSLSWTQPRAIFLATVAIFALVVIAAWALVAWSDYRETIQQAKVQTQNIASLLEEHAQRTIEASDLALLRARDLIEVVGVDRIASAEAVWTKFARLAENLPQVGSLWIIGADGNVVTSSFQQAPLPGNYTDRDYFRAHRDQEEAFFIGEQLVGRATGKPFFSISRPFATPDGAFGGIVVVAIHTEYFTDFYETLELGPRSAVGIFRRDGAVLARHPALTGADGAKFPQISQAATGVAAARTFIGLSPVDGVERAITIRELSRYPLAVTASIAKSAALEDWRARLARNGLFAAAALLTIAGLARLGFRSLRRESEARSALQEAKDTLEQRVEERTAELRDLVNQREILLREVHHRVKNNLQSIVGMMTVQAATVGDELRGYFDDTLLRITAMARLHEQLYNSDRLRGVDVANFLQRLCREVTSFYGVGERIRCRIEAERLLFNLDVATPVALVAGELLSNACKHAFPDDRHGEIAISLRRTGGRIVLTIRDNGAGLPPGVGERKRSSMGLRLIDGLARQIGGDISLESGPGTKVTMTFDAPVPVDATELPGARV